MSTSSTKLKYTQHGTVYVPKNTLLIPNLDRIQSAAKKTVRNRTPKSPVTNAVVMFDLSGSTKLKMDKGHMKAKQKMDLHNEICKHVCRNTHGIVVKELGDGVLTVFKDITDSIRASVSALYLFKKNKIDSKIVITYGNVEQVGTGKRIDVIGSIVDRCARIEKFALPNQILVDGTVREVMADFLMDYPGVEISQPFEVHVKDQGILSLYELGSRYNPLRNKLNAPLEISESGRLSVKDKVVFMRSAKKEIMEIGLGIRQFVHQFIGRNPTQFREPVIDLLRKGVTLRCYAIDYNWIRIKNIVQDKEYCNQIEQNLNELYGIKRELVKNGLGGRFHLHTYQEIGYFHATAADMGSSDAKILVSNYLPGIRRSECPVMKFSKESNPTMFNRYERAIQNIIRKSKKWHP